MNKIFKALEKSFGQYPFSIISTNFFAFFFSFVIAWLCWQVSTESLPRVVNALVALSGAITGWALGMFFAPFSEKEAAKFSSIGQAVSAFVSGYVISKLDRFLEAVMFQEQVPVTITWVRFGLFFCSLMLVMLAVFSNRAYFRAEHPTQSLEPEKTEPEAMPLN